MFSNGANRKEHHWMRKGNVILTISQLPDVFSQVQELHNYPRHFQLLCCHFTAPV